MFEDLSNYIYQRLQNKVEEAGLNNYEIFGKEVENPVSDLVEDYLNENNIPYSAHRATNKNEFPDLKLTIYGTEYAFEHKAGASDEGPNNDMGTLNAYPEKIDNYQDNIYCVFVKYSKATEDNGIVINEVYFDKIYRFIGKTASGNGILKYRKKDGNLRPKVWNDFSSNTVYFDSLEEFNDGIEKTIEYRAEKLVEQHIKSLNPKSLKRVYNKIGEILK